MSYDLKLRPIHYASVSGGKDSLYMLNLILNNPDKYPLDMVVHFELEIDWDWSKNVIDFMEERCKNAGIPFYRIKPRKSWYDMYEKFGLPLRVNSKKWCNTQYKLDAKYQLEEWIKSQNYRPVAYIGLCADEQKRFKYEIGDWKNQDVCYPLAEEGINEDIILEWAKGVKMFNHWYEIIPRQGCMFCPNARMIELAYMKVFYPDKYEWFGNLVKDWEDKYKDNHKGDGWYFNHEWSKNDRIVTEKWIPKLYEALLTSL